MNKIKLLLVLMTALILSNCTEVGESYLDANGENYLDFMAVDKDTNGKADAYEDHDYDDTLNYLDRTYLTDIDPRLDTLLNDLKPADLDTDQNPTDSDDVDIPVIPFKKGEPYLSVGTIYYEVFAGQSFDPVTELDYIALDKDSVDASEEVTFSNDYDINIVGEYVIVITYGDLTKNVTLSVKSEGGVIDPIGDFDISIEHDYKQSDTLIQVPEGNLKLDLPKITATVKEGGAEATTSFNSTKSTIGTGDNLDTPGTYYLYYVVVHPEKSEISTNFRVTVKVTGEASLSFDTEPEGDEFTVQSSANYTLPTVTSAFDGEKDIDAADIVVDDVDGFDGSKGGKYTVNYKTADGITLRTLVITVSEAPASSETWDLNAAMDTKQGGTIKTVTIISKKDHLGAILPIHIGIQAGQDNEGKFSGKFVVDGKEISVSGQYSDNSTLITPTKDQFDMVIEFDNTVDLMISAY